VLDFKMERKCLLTEEVEFSENPISGVITVGTKASIKKIKDVFKDSRYIEFVNVFQLSNALESGVGSIGITFNRKEDELDKAELERFLGSFVKANLITQDTASKAANRALGESGSMIEDAEVVAGLRWNAGQLANLFDRDAQLGVDLIIGEVVKEMNVLRVIKESHLDRLQRDLKFDQIIRDIDLDSSKPGDALAFFTAPNMLSLFEQLQGRDSGLGQTSSSVIKKLAKWHELAIDLHRAIQLMREVYYSGAALPEADYHDFSKQINDCLRGWIEDASLLEIAFTLLPFIKNSADDEIKSSMLALLKILNRLTAGPDVEQSAVSVAMTVGEGKKKKITTLV
jgi:hypothetical protein